MKKTVLAISCFLMVPLSSCNKTPEPGKEVEFLLNKKAMIYSYQSDVPTLETWEIGKRIDSIDDIPVMASAKEVACVAINGDEVDFSMLTPEFMQQIYEHIFQGNSALFLYHFEDVSFLKGTSFRYYNKVDEYHASYSEPVYFYNHGGTQSFHYSFGGNGGSTPRPEYEDAVTNWFHQVLYSYYLRE